MKAEILSSKLIASVLLLLAGFSAGVGMNLLPMRAVVNSAPGDPNPALKSVEHDATLAGDGTASEPLGVANGAISAPKLSAATPPSEGQVLGFNGANLAWQNPNVGGVTVVDSIGQEVGPLVTVSTLLLRVNGFTFWTHVEINGFPQNHDFAVFYHTTSDCSGPRYLVENGGAFFRASFNSGIQLFYPDDPLQQITINSY
ncbi:MAG: hypothetical protein HYX73_02190 [Acidobacteria bacterium]|nr:hypothetical protein [Acidobacteriota bacterium]